MFRNSDEKVNADITCSEKRTVFRNRSASFEEQIMCKDKYPSIFLKSNGSYCVHYPSNIFRNFTWGIFSHVSRLDQSHVSEII